MNTTFSKLQLVRVAGILLFLLMFILDVNPLLKYFLAGVGILLFSYTGLRTWKEYMFSLSKTLFIFFALPLFFLLTMWQEPPLAVKHFFLLYTVTLLSFGLGVLVRGYKPPLQLSGKIFFILDFVAPIALMASCLLYAGLYVLMTYLNL